LQRLLQQCQQTWVLFLVAVFLHAAATDASVAVVLLLLLQ